MNSLNKLNLKFNPFLEITPSFENTNPFWAGMIEVKSKIEKCYSDCLNNHSKQMVLNWGPYGGGKTFSAYYFINKYRDNDNITHLYLRSPKDGGSATDEFFKSIIDYLAFDKIHKHIFNLIELNGEDALMNFLTPKAGREYAKAICLIGSDNPDVVDLMNSFLYRGLTKTELKKLELPKDIQTSTDSIKFLTGIFSCFIGSKQLGYEGKVVLWLDEMEDLIYYSGKHYKAFSQVIRDLFDSINTNFLSFLNFTLAEGEEGTIELILGGAVWSRISKKIRYKQFNSSDAIKYCGDLLNEAKENKKLDKPFSDQTIDRIIALIPIGNLTPREINKHFNSLINYTLEHNKGEVNDKLFADWEKEYQEDN